MAEAPDFISRGQFKKLAEKKKEEERDVLSWAQLQLNLWNKKD